VTSKIFPMLNKVNPYYVTDYGEAWLGDARQLLQESFIVSSKMKAVLS
jgi:hypothetical protein